MDFCYSHYGFIISLDFGNSFSGSCYADTGKKSPKEMRESPNPSIFHVTDWPEQYDLKHKTPTMIINNQDNHFLHWGMSALNCISSNQLEDLLVIENFKFGLPTSIAQKGAFYLAGSTSENQLIRMRATIDYFREIFNHTVNAMIATDVIGLKVKIEDIRFIITVPELWSDAQRALIRIIAIEAGLISEMDYENRLLIINDSLAATVYCDQKPNIRNIKSHNRLLNNDKYMICDAGGATVSITVFESSDSFRGCQLTSDIIHDCGSVFLDLKMKEILLDICFGGEKEFWYDDLSKRLKLESVITTLTDQFLQEKTLFGTRVKDFIPDCCREKFEMYDPNDIDSDSWPIPECDFCDFANGNDEKFVQLDNFGDDTIFTITQGRILNQLKLRKNWKGAITTHEGVTIEDDDNHCEIRFSYKYMRENVFDEVVNNTINLLRRQIKKANGNIARTYLVGGFGGTPYLRKRILNEFPVNSPLSIGELIEDDRGDIATMRGGLMYGFDAGRSEPPSDVVVEIYDDDSTSQFNTLICLDIGYDTTACSYRSLINGDTKMTGINNWPGLNEKSSNIPTAKKHSGIKTLWGAQIEQATNSIPELFVTPSKLMSSVKGIFKAYLVDFLKRVLQHVYNVIKEEEIPELSDKTKYRYVITMENCYPFFKNKSEMHDIVKMAGIVNKGDSEKRLLLIHRENAAAMYFEKCILTENKTGSNQFLQISMYHDTCHLSLHESTKIVGQIVPAYKFRLPDETVLKKLRNVRNIASTTFEFNFVSKLVKNLALFISSSVCCKDQKSHDKTSLEYILELRTNFLEYMKNKLDFNSCEPQTIKVTKTPGCQISITKYQVLEHVFWPTIREFTSAINCHGLRHNLFRLFNINNIAKIFLSGFVIEAKKETHEFLEKIIIKNLTEIMNVKKDIISFSADNGKEALLGAAYYGNYPEHFTERVSRKSYAVRVSGYKIQEFEMDVQKNISEIQKKGEKSMKHDIYNEESSNAFIDEKNPVSLYHQSSYNPTLKNIDFKKYPDDRILLINRGDRISEYNEMHGILKRFYAKEECFVYVMVYCSESDILSEDEAVDLSHFHKIHQFGLYIKRDKDDPTTAAPDSRLYFDVHLKIDKNSIIFEAYACSKLGRKNPQFRFRDNFLVGNIYGDKERITVDNLKIKA